MTQPLPAVAGALFVDFENIYYNLVNEPLSLQREGALTAVMDALSELRRKFRDQNVALIVERSYGDFEKLPILAQRQLQIAGILPRFVDSRLDKSTADIELSLDVYHHLLTRPELRHIILVGGDRDYLPILRRIKEHHRAIIVCSLRGSLAGDVREFASHYAEARIVELDELVELSKYPRARSATPDIAAPVTAPTGPAPEPAPPRPATLPPPPVTSAYDPKSDEYEWHERYISTMMRFMQEHRYKEIHLGPFFRWLRSERVFELVSEAELRKVFADLQAMDAVRVEERDTGQGYPFSVASLNYNHAIVRKVCVP